MNESYKFLIGTVHAVIISQMEKGDASSAKSEQTLAQFNT